MKEEGALTCTDILGNQQSKLDGLTLSRSARLPLRATETPYTVHGDPEEQPCLVERIITTNVEVGLDEVM
jgi:hypothetical protein